MLTPPALLFRSFGIPPANKPPSCGAESVDAAPPPEPWSLLLLALFCPAGAGGRKLAPPEVGMGGAPPIGGPALDELLLLSTIGAERSLTWTFLSRVPFAMSPKSAP